MSNLEFNELSDLALERGFHLRDNRASTLDGRGYTLRPLKLNPGIRTMVHADDLAGVADALAKYRPVDGGFPMLLDGDFKACVEISMPGQTPSWGPVSTQAADWNLCREIPLDSGTVTALKPEHTTPQVLRGDVTEGIEPTRAVTDFVARKMRAP